MIITPYNSLERCRAFLKARAPYLIGLVSIACGDTNAAVEPEALTYAISGSGAVETSEYPEVGQLVGEGETIGSCTGTLIDESWVIAADHCKDKVAILLGPDAEHAVSYPLDGLRFRQPTGGKNEVTLLHLTTPAVGAPIGTLYPDPLTLGHEECTAVGYGPSTTADDGTGAGTKRKASLTIDSVEKDEITFDVHDARLEGGDSGGPLMCNGMVAAVTRTRASYSPIDVAWVRRAIADPSSQPEVPDETNNKPTVTPEIKIEGYEGDLCPEGALSGYMGSFHGFDPAAPVESDVTQTCRIALTVTIPAGKQLDASIICSSFTGLDRTTATVAYSVPGYSTEPLPHEVRAARETADTTCDALPLTASACSGEPVDVPVTIEIAADVQAGNAVTITALDATFDENSGRGTWSDCDNTAD